MPEVKLLMLLEWTEMNTRKASEKKWCLKASQRKSKNLPAGVSVKAFQAAEAVGTKAQSYSKSAVGFRE